MTDDHLLGITSYTKAYCLSVIFIYSMQKSVYYVSPYWAKLEIRFSPEGHS